MSYRLTKRKIIAGEIFYNGTWLTLSQYKTVRKAEREAMRLKRF